MTKLKCYFVGSYDQGGVCYICETRREALLKRSEVMREIDLEFIDVRVKEIKNADISGMLPGRVDDMKYGQLELVNRNIYGTQEGVTDTCPKCKTPNCDLSDYGYTDKDGKETYDWMCSECCEKAEAASVAALGKFGDTLSRALKDPEIQEDMKQIVKRINERQNN